MGDDQYKSARFNELALDKVDLDKVDIDKDVYERTQHFLNVRTLMIRDE